MTECSVSDSPIILYFTLTQLYSRTDQNKLSSSHLRIFLLSWCLSISLHRRPITVTLATIHLSKHCFTSFLYGLLHTHTQSNIVNSVPVWRLNTSSKAAGGSLFRPKNTSTDDFSYRTIKCVCVDSKLGLYYKIAGWRISKATGSQTDWWDKLNTLLSAVSSVTDMRWLHTVNWFNLKYWHWTGIVNPTPSKVITTKQHQMCKLWLEIYHVM